MDNLAKIVRYAIEQRVSGAFVECGVATGRFPKLMIKILNEMNEIKDIWLYDTFEGMPKPEPIDIKIHNNKKALDIWENKGNWHKYSLEEVKHNLIPMGYPVEHFTFVKGKVEDTIPETMPEKIALLRLDTDFYSSTKHEMEYLYPLIEPNGILIIDDYNHWQGCRKAIDEYIKEHEEPAFLKSISKEAVLSIKGAESFSDIGMEL